MVFRVLNRICMVVWDYSEDLYGGKGLHKICMVVRDSPQDLHGGLEFPRGSVWW